MADEVFVVGNKGVFFHNGIVVIDFMGLSHSDRDEKGRPKKEFRQRVMMTPSAMLETMEAMKGLTNKLVEMGFFKRGKPEEKTKD